MAVLATLLVSGLLVYAAVLPRQGFPAIDFPVAIANGAYLVDDKERVDADLASPIAAEIAKDPRVVEIQSYARSSSFTVIARLDPDVSSDAGITIVDDAIAAVGVPPQAQVISESRTAAKFLNAFDLVVAVTGHADATAEELEAVGDIVADQLVHSDIESVRRVDLIQRGEHPLTGQAIEVETSFAQRLTEDGFRPAIAVGVVAAPDVDAIGIHDAVLAALGDLDELPAGYDANIGLDFATTVRQQVGSLQQNVLTGLAAVMAVAFLLISWRASVLTAGFVLTVLAGCSLVLWVSGIGLNTLSLFGLILALGLFVDDAIVITESIDADPDDVVGAVERVGAATISGTLTTVLVFLPMLTIVGVLGDFIRILPITVAAALILSLLFSLGFIPPLGSMGMLGTRRRAPLARLEGAVRERLIRRIDVTGRQAIIRGGLAVGLSIAMTTAGVLVIAPALGFNIFPPAKDSTEIDLDINFESGTSLAAARSIATEVNERTSETLGEHLVSAYQFRGNSGSIRTRLTLTPMGDRPSVHELVEELTAAHGGQFDTHRVRFSQRGAGPPETLFPFLVQVFAEDPEVSQRVAGDIEAALRDAELRIATGETVRVLETNTGLIHVVARWDGDRLVEVRGRFDNDQTSATTQAARAFLLNRFGERFVDEVSGESVRLGFDFGAESENQESFSSLPLAFLIATALILALLVVQFRSLTQWILVFLAIPFSAFGAFGTLWLAGHELSFFVALGALGLIGIAVNNTILLTDCANRHRNAGLGAREAMMHAMRERFRPLVVTTATTIASLLPLALSDPFWQPLAWTIIGGLLSSTFLVLVAFPFYYRALEASRDRVRYRFAHASRSSDDRSNRRAGSHGDSAGGDQPEQLLARHGFS